MSDWGVGVSGDEGVELNGGSGGFDGWETRFNE